MNAKFTKIGLCLTLIALALEGLIYFLHPFTTAMERGQTAKVRADIMAGSDQLAVDFK